MTKQIDDALGLSSTLPVVIDADEHLPVVQNNEQAVNDIDQSREGLFDAFKKAQSAVEDMMAIAQQSQHPKAYEVLNQSIKTLADISMGITDLQIKKQKIFGRSEPKTVNNNLYVGTTADLLDMLEQIKGNGE